MHTDASGNVSNLSGHERWLRYIIPRSLQGQFSLAFSVLALLILIGGGTTLYSMHQLTVSSKQLTEERLAHMQAAQDLVEQTSLISLKADQLATIESADEVDQIFADMLMHLEKFDFLVEKFGATSESVAVLDLHQASQLLRNTVNVTFQLRKDILRSNTISNQHSSTASANIEYNINDLFSSRLKVLKEQDALRNLRHELHQQTLAMMSSARSLSATFTEEYKRAVQLLADTSKRNQQWGLALLAGGVLFSWLILHLFLGRHIAHRLQQISHYLRCDVPDTELNIVPVEGRDEIGDMARSLERFLEDRRLLVYTRASLEVEQRRLSAIIDHTADGIIVLECGLIRQINRAGETLFGWQSGEITDRPIDELLSQSDPPLAALYSGVRNALGHNRNGQSFPVEVSINDVSTDRGTLSILVVRDATLRKQVEQQLLAARDAAVAARNAQTTFLANMSHELRTPLNAILGYAQVLQRDKGLKEQQLAGLNTIRSSGEHLLTLINDVLDISKIEAGKLEILPGPVNLSNFLQVVNDIIQVKAKLKNLKFVFDRIGELPRVVQVDERRLRQILLNLLGNAVKFTDQGEVRITVQTLSLNESEARIRFKIQDTGIGMDAVQLHRIFRPFEQVGDPSRRQGGTGLGLAISQQLIHLMGSNIEVTSEPGKGSLFWFELNLSTPSTHAEVAPTKHAILGYRGSPKKILIVDDVAENRQMLSYLLTTVGFQTEEAVNGLEGVSRAQEIHPDLILMDMMMPVMDGLEATHGIRGMEQLTNVPIIIVSASVSPEDRMKCRTAGADAFLAKPIGQDSLLEQIGILLKLDWVFDQSSLQPHDDGANVSSLIVPANEQLKVLYGHALVGDMRKVRAETIRLVAADEKYRPFGNKVLQLAMKYQVKTLVTLFRDCIKHHD